MFSSLFALTVVHDLLLLALHALRWISPGLLDLATVHHCAQLVGVGHSAAGSDDDRHRLLECTSYGYRVANECTDCKFAKRWMACGLHRSAISRWDPPSNRRTWNYAAAPGASTSEGEMLTYD